MRTIEISPAKLFDAVSQMPQDEFDAFIEKAIAARTQGTEPTLSAAETKLLRRINRGLPSAMQERYSHLIARRKKSVLTTDEHQELVHLTHEAETRDAERAADLLELAKLRHIPVRVLMKQMGIKPTAVHG